jgi:hypothetical protein
VGRRLDGGVKWIRFDMDAIFWISQSMKMEKSYSSTILGIDRVLPTKASRIRGLAMA